MRSRWLYLCQVLFYLLFFFCVFIDRDENGQQCLTTTTTRTTTTMFIHSLGSYYTLTTANYNKLQQIMNEMCVKSRVRGINELCGFRVIPLPFTCKTNKTNGLIETSK